MLGNFQSSELNIKLWPSEAVRLARAQKPVTTCYRELFDGIPNGYPSDGSVTVDLFSATDDGPLKLLEINGSDIELRPPYIDARLDRYGNLKVRVADTFLFEDYKAASEISVSTGGISTVNLVCLRAMSLGRVTLRRDNQPL